MDRVQVLDMINANRQYIKLRSNIAVQNLAMLHKSFGHIQDEECILALALNDSEAAMLFNSDYVRGIAICEDMIARYGHTPYPRLLAALRSLAGRCYTFMMRYDDGLEQLRTAEQIAFGEEDEPDAELLGLRVEILQNLAMHGYYSDGDDEQTLAYLHRALELLPEGVQGNRRGVSLMGMANVMSRRGDLAAALEHHRQALALFEEVDNRCNIATVLCNMGSCYGRMGHFEQAQECLDRALDMRTRLGTYWEISNTYYNLGKLYQAREEHQRAYDTMIIARDYALVSQHRGLQSLILEELKSMTAGLGEQALHQASIKADIAA